MENDQSIENVENSHNINNSFIREINKSKDELIMEASNIKTNSQSPQISLSVSKSVSNTSSPKMGSRRIFTPQFKLQVLESYRNDHDCKGNQRATARKYNIHRRQIQKWLQCEPSLRSSVANINQNSVKHQFHNVSIDQQQVKNVITSKSSVNGLSYPSNQIHSTHLCLETTKSSTIHKAIDVPSLSTCVSLPTTQETKDILDGNLAAAVAAAAGTIARSNSSNTSSTSSLPVISPMRPSAIITASRNTNSSIAPLLHHHHHYGIPTYNNITPTATVPILVHHINNTQPAPYQYHHMPPSYTSPTLTHHQNEKQHTSYFTPTLISNNYSGTNNDQSEKLDLLPMDNKTYSKLISEKSFLYNNPFHINYECPDNSHLINPSKPLDSIAVNSINGDTSYSATYPFAPMDLSLRHNRETKAELVVSVKTQLQTNEIPIKIEKIENSVGVVDLTYRKRRGISPSQSSNHFKHEYPEKQQKLSNISHAVPNTLVSYETNETYNNQVISNPSYSSEDDDIEIEVGTEEKFPPASKPVKLFKPYLLDDCENDTDKNNSNLDKISKIEKSEEERKYFTKNSTDEQNITENTFLDAIKEDNNNCVDSSNFLIEYRSESPRSACSPPITYIPTMSPTNFHYCKGSPAASSGYESSTSSYSDISLSSKNDTYIYGQTYSLNLQMQTIYQENIHHISHPSKHVQRWLEKDDSNSLETNPTIALFA